MVEVLGKDWMVLMDSCNGLAQRSCDAHARSFGRGAGAPCTPAETDGSCEFPKQEIPFGLRLTRPLDVVQAPRFDQVLFDLGQSPPISRFGLGIKVIGGNRL